MIMVISLGVNLFITTKNHTQKSRCFLRYSLSAISFSSRRDGRSTTVRNVKKGRLKNKKAEWKKENRATHFDSFCNNRLRHLNFWMACTLLAISLRYNCLHTPRLNCFKLWAKKKSCNTRPSLHVVSRPCFLVFYVFDSL